MNRVLSSCALGSTGTDGENGSTRHSRPSQRSLSPAGRRLEFGVLDKACLNNHQPRKKDMSWGALIGALGILFIVAMVLIPVPSRGPGGQGLVPSDCLGELLGVSTAGVVFIVLVSATISRRRRAYYSTPKRDVAIAAFIVFLFQIYFWPLACFA